MNLANKITLIRIGMIPLFVLALQKYPTWMVEQFSFLEYLNTTGVVAITAVLLGNFPFSYITGLQIDMAIMLAAVALTAYSGYRYLRNNYQLLQLKM